MSVKRSVHLFDNGFLRNAVRAIVVCLRSMVDGAMAMVDGAMAMVDGR